MNIDQFQVLISSILEKETIDVWKNFIEENKISFEETSICNNETKQSSTNSQDIEHSLFQYDIYSNFKSLIDDILSKKCVKNNITINQFYEHCRDNFNEPYIKAFYDVFMMSTSFEIFSEMMRDKGKQQYLFMILNSWSNLNHK
jgi:hypothetical protein